MYNTKKNRWKSKKSTITIICLALLLVVLWLIFGRQFSNKPNYDISKLTSLIEQIPNNEDIDSLSNNLQSKDCGLKKLSALALYKNNPQKYRSLLFEEFIVNDYNDRRNGLYNFVPVSETISTIKDIESKYPEYNPPVILVYTFCEVQGNNIWIQNSKQENISFSRFLRGAIFSNYLNSTNESVNLANEIDLWAENRN